MARSAAASAWIVPSFALLLGGCGEYRGQATSGVETAVDTVSGVAYVSNAGPAPEWGAERVLRLGSVEGGPEEFGRIRSLLADADGNVYVADNLAHQIRVFSREGRHLRTIGRQGSGPGEFGDLYGLAWLDGNVAAMDPGNARIAVFSPRGEWIEAVQHFPITGPPSLIRLFPLGGAAFYGPVIDFESQSLPFVRFTAAGPGDTIQAPQRQAAGRPTGVVCHRPDGGLTSITLPQAPGVVYAFPPPGGAMAVSWTETYRIAWLDARGDTTRVVSRERPPVPYSEELWEQGMRPYRELRETFPGARCEPSAPERPRHRAALRHISFDEDGRMWVEAADEEGFVWEVFDDEGRLLGAVRTPRRSPGIPPYIRGGHLYQVEIDELDVQYVAVYRVDSAGSIPT